jgi:hypothetical protein
MYIMDWSYGVDDHANLGLGASCSIVLTGQGGPIHVQHLPGQQKECLVETEIPFVIVLMA